MLEDPLVRLQHLVDLIVQLLNQHEVFSSRERMKANVLRITSRIHAQMIDYYERKQSVNGYSGRQIAISPDDDETL